MRNFASVCTLVVGMSTFAHAPINWPINRTEQSLLKLELIDPSKRNEETGQPARGSCTIISIEYPYFATAGHCLVGVMFIGEVIFDAVAVDTKNDIAIIKGDIKRPGLRLGKKPHRGEKVLIMGYSAPPELLFWEALVVGDFDPWMKGEVGVVTSANAAFGMSGGAIINEDGYLVGMITGGGNPSTAFQNIGTGVTYEALKRTIQRVMLITSSER